MILFTGLCVVLVSHITGEALWERGSPFWRYVTRTLGIGSWVSRPLGLALFGGLLAVQIALASLWFFCGFESALWLLIGAMAGDAMLSHLWLTWQFRSEPNPGRLTALLYVPLIVAAFVLFPFRPVEFALGWSVFGGFWAVAWWLKSASPRQVADTLVNVALGLVMATAVAFFTLAALLWLRGLEASR